jgi:RNA polymerase-associated protein RTF1
LRRKSRRKHQSKFLRGRPPKTYFCVHTCVAHLVAVNFRPVKKPEKPAPAKKAPDKKPAPDSDAMEESEDDDDESSEEEAELDMETFDTQRLVKDEADQKYLDSLPEFEREAILGERFEKRKADQDMKKALRESKRKKREEKAATQKDTKKRKAATPAKKPAKKVKEVGIAEGDAELAEALAEKRESGRNKDATGTKAQKTKALAALREVSIWHDVMRWICSITDGL